MKIKIETTDDGLKIKGTITNSELSFVREFVNKIDEKLREAQINKKKK